jgi:peptidyl-dipeptidase Dcp
MKILLYILTLVVFCVLCYAQDQKITDNPFFKEWTTPFETPPFNDIKVEHFMPAYEEGMKQHNTEIDAIINDAGKPTFQNTIGALEQSGILPV